MANFWIWSSLAAFCAVVAQQGTWFTRLKASLKHKPSNIVSPLVQNENGWTLIHCDDADSFEDWLGQDSGLPFNEGEIPSLGSHLLIELYGCDGKSLESEDSVAGAMHEAARRSNATIVEHSFHEFKPYGVSGAVIIQESHYTIHTWPEHGYAAVDLFYCGGTVQVQEAVQVLRDRFLPQRIKFLVVRRGLQSEVVR